MKRTRLNPMSLNKIKQLNAEVPTRIKLCKRAGGKPYISTRTIRLNDGSKHELVTVRCIDGKCQCGNCDGERGELHPHEYRLTRAHGGKVSLSNSKMLLNNHHAKAQRSETHLEWLK